MPVNETVYMRMMGEEFDGGDVGGRVDDGE
jgi:hypothetical protein